MRWWNGGTLAIGTTGYDEDFWIDRRVLPTTEQLRTIERLTRTDLGRMLYELAIDDPGTYTRAGATGLDLCWQLDDELFECLYQQANYAVELVVGEHESVDRTSPIVPQTRA